MTTIADTAEWKALEAHAKEIRKMHLRDLVGDGERRASLTVSANDFILDCSRQNATPETKQLLLALSRAANLEGKKSNMFLGAKINDTEGARKDVIEEGIEDNHYITTITTTITKHIM